MGVKTALIRIGISAEFKFVLLPLENKSLTQQISNCWTSPSLILQEARNLMHKPLLRLFYLLYKRIGHYWILGLEIGWNHNTSYFLTRWSKVFLSTEVENS